MAHSHAGTACAHPTKKACQLARRAAMGQCQEMIESKHEPHPCPHWAIDRIDDRGYCGQHINSVALAAVEASRKERRTAEINERIDAYMTWCNDHPSVWDKMGSPVC